MTRNRQKCEELARFEVFRKEFHEFPLPEACVGERPDLLVNYGGQVIGIEIMELCLAEHESPKRPYGRSALDGIQRRIVRDALRRYDKEKMPSLDVRVWFCTHMKHLKLRPKRSAEIAKAICDLVKEWVALSVPHGDLRPGKRIPEVSRVSTARGVSVPQWERVSPCWLGTLSIEEIQQRIDDKDVLYETYRRKCDQCWLLMVTDRYNPGQAFRPTFYETLRGRLFSYTFDRIFVLEACPCHEQLVELSRADE